MTANHGYMREKRRIGVLIKLSGAELRALERLMSAKGFRRRADAMRFAAMVVANEPELANACVPRAAARRALDPRRIRVVSAPAASDRDHAGDERGDAGEPE